MNRNVESHFAMLPSVEIERSTFDRSFSHKTSMNVGDIVPFLVEEVLPGDTFDITTSKVIRSQTLLTPIMDNIYADTYYFFCPNRLLWGHWKEFCGENTQGAWAPSVEYTIPSIASPEGGFQPGTIADYMGLPVGVEWNATDELSPSALPFRAYALVCNEFFRDQNLTDPLLIPLDDANQTGVNTGNYITDVANGGKPFKAAKFHDFFTSGLPAPQKGSAVGIPIDVPLFAGGSYPVITTKNSTLPSSFYPLSFAESSTGSSDYRNPSLVTPVSGSNFLTSNDNADLRVNAADQSGLSGNHYFAPLNLGVEIPSPASGDTATAEFSVNELRLAFAYQRFLESLARSGSRYTELVLGLFGVRSPDARLQRPEYLGGNRINIMISEVTNTAQSQNDFVGDLGAKSHTNDRHHSFVKSFTEHGVLLGLMVLRYDHSYSQGIQKFWSRKKFTDFYNPKFAHLGEVPIYMSEIFADGNMSKENVFAYQEIWADYRYKPNQVSGEMRPGVNNSLAYWHLGDYYSEAPTLSDEWIRETPVNVDRVLAVTSEVANQFWADIYVQNYCTRPMPMYSVPGLIDHF